MEGCGTYIMYEGNLDGTFVHLFLIKGEVIKFSDNACRPCLTIYCDLTG